jgi:hypothetical protein
MTTEAGGSGNSDRDAAWKKFQARMTEINARKAAGLPIYDEVSDENLVEGLHALDVTLAQTPHAMERSIGHLISEAEEIVREGRGDT